ncbi:PHB depolymerase family esterase [Schlegelella sp. S2-27]|uniref:PHB depolymerase family esterase n=1 Tax=Caldimonas mangrovi TaxID=2944811 RepID=A0ABT0YWM1_9BURK|nr:PHB depolymerase family esterase [Caldimonas mangrovi]MCM5682248.1 PHB depolymerase family esterase [Caldimonas mangrovi]
MNSTFQRLMAQATQLTRAGDLRGATAAIQAALAGGAAPPPAPADADVIDVPARELVEPVAPLNRAAPVAGEFITGSYTGAAGTRDYKLYVPPGAHGRRLPLVVMLHGCTQNPDDFAAGTRMNEAAREQGFLVLYPAQTQQANPSRCWNWFKHNHQRRGRGEPELLAGMTREVTARHGADHRRVYVAGLSAGGAMAAILGAAYPELYAAVGVHSGLPVGSARDVKTAFDAMKNGAAGKARTAMPPTIVFHGDRDTTVHPLNGKQVAADCIGACEPQLERARHANGRHYTRRTYRDANGRLAAEHWEVHGAGHAWSGGSARGSYTDGQGPDATAEMLRFFFLQAQREAG